MTLDTNTVTNTQQFDRVRNHTSDQVNEQIDQKIEAQVQQYINELPNRSKLRGITSLHLTHFVARLRSTTPYRALFY